jgi:sugar lactone lactonase YvrE
MIWQRLNKKRSAMKIESIFRVTSIACLAVSTACTHGAQEESAVSSPASRVSAMPSPIAYPLPGARLFPESIGYDQQTRDFYIGGLLDGSIVRGNAASATQATVVLPAGTDGRASAAGIKVDRQRRLWVAGGESAKLFVYQLGSLKLLATFAAREGPRRVVNDIAIAADGEAYVTDSAYPALYHVVMREKPTFEEWPVDPLVVPYWGAYNLNGIVVTPDQAALLLVQTSTGKLFRFERSTHAYTIVDLGGGSVPAGDGLAISGQSIFVACNATGSVARISMSSDFRSGEVVTNAPNPRLGFPTAIALDGDGLLVVNAQLDALAAGRSPTLPFTVTRLAAGSL